MNDEYRKNMIINTYNKFCPEHMQVSSICKIVYEMAICYDNNLFEHIYIDDVGLALYLKLKKIVKNNN